MLWSVQDQIQHSLRDVRWNVPVYLGPQEAVSYREQVTTSDCFWPKEAILLRTQRPDVALSGPFKNSR